jgi:hypothetical protein
MIEVGAEWRLSTEKAPQLVVAAGTDHNLAMESVSGTRARSLEVVARHTADAAELVRAESRESGAVVSAGQDCAFDGRPSTGTYAYDPHLFLYNFNRPPQRSFCRGFDPSRRLSLP